VPPEDEYSQLKRSLIGDMTANLEFIDSFLSDFININISSDFVILYKPKYSLGNYSNEYKKVINSLIDKFYDKFVLLDPYVRFEDLMNITDLAISFPYTSTYKFAKYSGVNSFFYIPDAYIKDFIFYGKRNDCLYGIESVNSYISSLGRGDK
jgi:polysaccharide biosynthesis PFTS motif protein